MVTPITDTFAALFKRITGILTLNWSMGPPGPLLAAVLLIAENE